MSFLLVALGGAAGSVMRYAATLAGTRLLGPNLPYGTFFVNVTGSFLMGVVVEIVVRRFNGSNEVRLLLATGFLGGYTTFSSFSLDTIVLWERGEAMTAAAYVAASVLLGIGALFAGLALSRHLL